MGMPAATTAARHLVRTSLHRRCSDGASTPCCEKDAVPKMEPRESQRGDWGRTWLHPSRPWRQTGAGPRGSSGAGSFAQAATALTQPTRSGRSRANRAFPRVATANSAEPSPPPPVLRQSPPPSVGVERMVCWWLRNCAREAED